MREKWDTHHHINPDFYVDELERYGLKKVWGLEQPSWSVREQLGMMRKYNVSRSFMSISTPGVSFGNGNAALELSRRCNDYMAGLIQHDPRRLGAFASVPLPDGDKAAGELVRALDSLSLDGVCLMSNVDGKYIGSEEYASFWQEADKRRAVIFIHPTTPPDKKDHIHLNFLYHFKCETTHAIIDFFRNGLHKRYPRIRFILSHGGGVLPSVFPMLLKELLKENSRAREEWDEFRSRIYLDLALTGYKEMIPSIVNLTGIDNILYGSDWCWARKSFAYTMKLIESYPFEGNDIQKILLGNALRLFGPETDEGIGKPGTEPRYDHPGELNDIPHSHKLPRDVVIRLKSEYPEIDLEGSCETPPQGDLSAKGNKSPTPSLLVPDLNCVWEQKEKDLPHVLRAYNQALCHSDRIDRARTKILGAIDSENRDQALSEISFCQKNLNMDGFCLFIDVYNTNRDEFISDDILDRLAECRMPVLLHPKKRESSALFEGGHSESVYFIAKMFYLGKSSYLRKIDFILGHSFGLNTFLAQSINILYYFQMEKQHLFRYLLDWLITKDLKGLKYLREAKVSE